LNRTNSGRAVLLEICFVNSRTDVRKYQENFEAICRNIAVVLSGKVITATLPAAYTGKPCT